MNDRSRKEVSLIDDRSIMIRSVCGRIDDKPVVYELRIACLEPTAKMLRKAKAAIDLLVQWAEEDEARAATSLLPEKSNE